MNRIRSYITQKTCSSNHADIKPHAILWNEIRRIRLVECKKKWKLLRLLPSK
jgi:hypothetical protein